MTPTRRLPWWPAVLLALVGLGALYADALGTRFLNDDYLFLEQARAHPLLESLPRLGALGNYYRPLSRQIYFEVLTPLAGYSPLAFHLVNAALFAAALALLLDLLLVFATPAGALAGALVFALLPLQRVNLIWISCSQDLLALVLALAALALFRRGRIGLSCLAYLGAMASKEIAIPLPLALAAWLALGLPLRGAAASEPWPRSARRLWPYAATAVVWLAVVLMVRARFGGTPLGFTAVATVLTLVHGVQSMLGLEHPAGIVRGLADNAPALIPLAALAALALWIGRDRSPAPDAGATTSSRRAMAFGATWMVLFSLPLAPVMHTWSSYYYTLAAVGAAVLIAVACRRIDRWGWVLLTAGALWWHAGSTSVRAFAITDRAWGWTSHLTPAYFSRSAALCDSLERQLDRIEPHAAPGSRFFFATLPPWAGFQMGNGALIRHHYRDSTLASYFYSQFAESTAADRLCRFLYWDGVSFAPLYRGSSAPWFQVGADLFLFGHPAGAAHAFRRGLAEGEGREDHLYWLGWAEFLSGDRPRAEAAWRSFGAVDDTAHYHWTLMRASNALLARDTTLSRRLLFEAIHAGIGRPEAHAALGQLLEWRQLKYGLMELKVAAFLDPRDFRSRHRLIVGLVEVQLDDQARREMDALMRVDQAWRRDAVLVLAKSVLDRRSAAGTRVMEF